MATQPVTLVPKRGLESNISSQIAIPGEIAITTDTHVVYVGNDLGEFEPINSSNKVLFYYLPDKFLTKEIGLTTYIDKSNFDPNAVFLNKQTFICDLEGTVGVFNDWDDVNTLMFTTISISPKLYERRYIGEFSTQSIQLNQFGNPIQDGQSFLDLTKSAQRFFGQSMVNRFPWKYIWFDFVSGFDPSIELRDVQFTNMDALVNKLLTLNSLWGSGNFINVKVYTKHYKNTAISAYGINYLRSVFVGRGNYTKSGIKTINTTTLYDANNVYVKEIVKQICLHTGVYTGPFDNTTYPKLVSCFWIKSKSKRMYNTRSVNFNWEKKYHIQNYGGKYAFKNGTLTQIYDPGSSGLTTDTVHKVYGQSYIIMQYVRKQGPLNNYDIYFQNTGSYNNGAFSMMLIRPIQIITSSDTWVYFDLAPLGVDTFKITNFNIENMNMSYSDNFDILATINQRGINPQRIQLLKSNVPWGSYLNQYVNFDKTDIINGTAALIKINSIKSESTYRFAIGNPNTGILSELSNGFRRYYDRKSRVDIILPENVFETIY